MEFVYFVGRFHFFMPKIIFLIGFMGAGKTTLGRKLAKRLNVQFIDSDKEIESIAQLSVADIFAKHGEGYFRKQERNWLENLSDEMPKLISVGGGMPCFQDNIRLLKEKGLVVYLKHPTGQLAHRLSNAKTQRPLLMNMTPIEIEKFVSKLLSEREVFYRKAHITVLPKEQNVNDLEMLILNYTK